MIGHNPVLLVFVLESADEEEYAGHQVDHEEDRNRYQEHSLDAGVQVYDLLESLEARIILHK